LKCDPVIVETGFVRKEIIHMNVLEALNGRYTVRAFRPDPIDKDTLRKILEAALQAPSWANTQPWEIVVAGGEVLNRLRTTYMENLKNCVPRKPDLPVPARWPRALQERMVALKGERLATLERECKDPAVIEEMSQLNYQFFKAPVVLYLCMDRTLTSWSIFDLGLFAQSLMLAAQHYGIGSAPAVTLAAHPDLIRAQLQIPEDRSIIIGIALGYADTEHPQNKYRSPRRTVQEAVTFEGL
jgi:nitroreductase